jgi:hypothetical protein
MIQLVVFLVLCMGTVWAQEEKPALPKEARQFDFWIGEWDLTWEGGDGAQYDFCDFGQCGDSGRICWGRF